jgi:AbiV family abortive infection protein
MAKSNKPKMGRPVTKAGTSPIISMRLPKDALEQVELAAKAQGITRSMALRRLVEGAIHTGVDRRQQAAKARAPSKKQPTSGSSVSPRYLLEGAVYALEQCGLLLRDANLLYQNGSHANVIVQAAFAQEELGRWKMLLGLRKKVIDGAHVTIKDIQSHCGDHVRKQEAGMMSMTMRTDRDSGLGRLLQARTNGVPGSRERKALDEQIAKLDQQRKGRIPSDRHNRRESALYVDAISADRWNRPSKEFGQTTALAVLTDAVNDYAIQYDQGYTNLDTAVKHDDPELFEALNQWKDRPELPRPKWPF